MVEDIHKALSLQSQFPSWSFVTLEGDLLTGDGVLSGGHKGDVSSGVLQREREIDELKKSKEEWTGKLALTKASMKKLESRMTQVNENLEKARKNETDKEILISGLKKDLQRTELEQTGVNQALNEQEQKLDEVLKETSKPWNNSPIWSSSFRKWWIKRGNWSPALKN